MDTVTLITKLRELFTIEIPDSLLSGIEVLFYDEDESNWSIENVAYRFKEPIECPFYPGYFYIPMFSRMAINKKGDLIVVRTGMVKKWGISKPSKESITGGYYISYGIRDNGKRYHISRHRSLCLTFKPYSKHPKHLWVNHEDGIPGNDDFVNINFCSPAENVKHAYDNGLYPTRVIAINAHNWKTGEELSFPSIQKCAEALGINHSLILFRLNKGNGKRHADGWRFKRSDNDWEVLEQHVFKAANQRAVIAKNIFTNEVSIFGSANEAAEMTKTVPGTIVKMCTNNSFAPVRGWLFRNLCGFEGWPNFNEKHIEMFKRKPLRPSQGIEVYDTLTGESLFFPCDEDAGLFFNKSPITITKYCTNNGTLDGRYNFTGLDYKNVPLLSPLSVMVE